MAINTTALVKASSFITIDADADITEGETLVIGGKTYTFNASLGSSDGDVQLGAAGAYALSAAAVAAAVNLDGTAGTDYAAAMTRNPYCDASWTADILTITARVAGAVGNLIPLTAGTSAAVADNATLENGSGSFDTFINELQAGFQLNSALLAVLEGAED
jgi:hypothetical protein